MKEIRLTTIIKVLDSKAGLSPEDRSLLELAHEGVRHAYVPYSDFWVSASVLLKNGAMLQGNNQENASYPLCLCAERTVLSAAASLHPGVPVVAIAITAKNPRQPIEQPVFPCGACRQVLVETENRYHQPIRVILQGETGPVYWIEDAGSLLPESFDGSQL